MSQTPLPQSSPQPGALCAAYAPLLSLLDTGELTFDEARSIRAHLTECAWCQARLAEYDALYSALRRQFDPDVVIVTAPSVQAIATLGRNVPISVPVRTAPRRPATTHPLPRIPLRAELAAVLLVAVLLGVLLGWQRGLLPGGAPPLDVKAQAYVAMLHADYQPVLDALGVDNRQCVNVFISAPQSDKKADMIACKPVEQNVVTRSQAFLTALAHTPPPARWQTAHSQLNTWANALIKAFSDRIRAIGAGDVTRFADLANSEIAPASGLSCNPIQQINADLPVASQLPASASGGCGS